MDFETFQPLFPDRPRLEFDVSAQAKALEFLSKPNYAGTRLRLYLAGKDCDGFMYGLNFDSDIHEKDILWEYQGIPLVCDAVTLKVCHGSTISWLESDEGRGFLVQNPNHSCFSGKFWRPKKTENEAVSHEDHSH